MLRTAIIVSLLMGACGNSSAGVKWPKPSPSETDGGESLAPRSVAAASLEDSDDDDLDLDLPIAEPDKADKAADKDKKDAKPADPARPATSTPEEPITTEEIVIEIED